MCRHELRLKDAASINVSSSRNCPQYFGLASLIRREPGLGGLPLGSRELLCLFGRIPRTPASLPLVIRAYLSGESASCQTKGESVS